MVENKSNYNKKAWVVAVDMGYGHQRTAYPLRDFAFGGKVINANNYGGISRKDQRIWKNNRSFYEFISRFRRIPYIGDLVFSIFDRFQRILVYYPKRDLSHPSLMLMDNYYSINNGWGRDLINKIKEAPFPLVTTFFDIAFMAEVFNYPNDIYCIICDADVSRSWAPLHPKKSRIKYFVPNTWTRDRLKLYGVKPEHIMLTGYPLPKENIGKNLEIIKKDLSYRIVNLDPTKKYQKLYQPLIGAHLGQLPTMANHPLTLMFSIGGAGAQKEIALGIINSLKDKIKNKELRFIVSVGTRDNLRQYFEDNVKDLELDGWLHVLSGKTIGEYFEKFNFALRTTDILMTKPSELSFYSGLGIPIIIEPSIGSQEDFNRRWLLHIGSATVQENPKYTDQWLFDLINGGDLAEMAMQGFIEIEKMGTYNMEKIITG